jgi:hypothetical protein
MAQRKTRPRLDALAGPSQAIGLQMAPFSSVVQPGFAAKIDTIACAVARQNFSSAPSSALEIEGAAKRFHGFDEAEAVVTSANPQRESGRERRRRRPYRPSDDEPSK